jgi:hypothetical protein
VNGRGKPLRRRTGLRPGGSLSRRTPLHRRRMRTARPVVSPAERAGRKVVSARSGGLCECCGMRRATDWQHRQNRSQQGAWAPSNGLHACRECHRWIHANPRRARARGWTVWSHERPADEAVLRRGDWVALGDDGAVIEVIGEYTGGPWQCESVHPGPLGGGLRCALGVLHDGDHECGLVLWPYTSEERASV